MEHVPEAHVEATVERCRTEPLAIQDTTALDCSGPGSTKGPDGGGKGSVGLAGLAVTPEGRPPGLMDAAFRQEPGEDSRVAGRARELAAACPDTRVVCEGDFRELRTPGPRCWCARDSACGRQRGVPAGACRGP